MKKKNILLAAMLLISGMVLTQQVNAQCCNIFASNGTTVITSDAHCATLAYSTTACEQPLIGVITGDVWVFYYDAFNDVRFATESDALNPTSYGALDKIATAMKRSDYTLKVSGYADSTGTQEYNKELSAKRAVAVRNYLLEKGVSSNKIVLAAYGEKMPKAPNRTKKGRAINRRVEFDLYY